MKHNYFSKIIILFILFFTTISAYSQLASYPLTANGTATGVDANITVSDFTSTGVSSLGFGTTGAFSSSWSTTTIDLGKYFEITLTPNAGYSMNITAINFSERRSGTGPRDYQVRWSVNDFSTSTTIATVNVPDDTLERDGSITGLDIDVAVGETLKIRWYGYNAEASGGTWRINDGTLNVVGTTTLTSTPTISFDSATSNANETNSTFSTTIPVSIINYAAPVTVSVTVNGSSTAEPADYTLNTTSLVFNANGTQNISIDINPDADTDHETVILDIAVTSGTATIATSQHTLTILDDEAPNVEDFTNSNATSSYANSSFVGNYGITWTYVASRDENSDANASGIDGKALMLRRVSDNSSVTSSTISGGIKDFSVKLYKGFTGGGSRQVEVFINSVSYGTSEIFDNFSENIFTINNINITGDFTIEIRNTTSNQIIVDDITWSSFSPTTITWNGSTSDWNTASNWDSNTIPTYGDNVVIADVTTAPIITATTDAKANILTINEPDGVTINAGGSLKVITSSTGTINFKVNVSNTAWHLVSSPVTGATYDATWMTNNEIASGSINSNNRGISTYQNGALNPTTGPWVYVQAADVGTFGTGTGYSLKKADAAADFNYTFSGTYTTGTVSPTITQNVSNWNLIGNPYSAYIDVAAFLIANTSKISSSFQTIYVWNGTAYTTLTNGYIHPGQAFFVNSASASTTVDFTTAMASHQTGVTFYKTNNTSVNLTVDNGSYAVTTYIDYVDGKTTGLDPRFDLGLFDGVSSDLRIFTHLLTDSQGINFYKQTLPNTDFESMIVPVGVKAAAGKELTFTAEAMNLPNGLKVFLEDRQTNTFTELTSSTNYKVTTTNALDGIGRFYIHTASSALSTTDVALDHVSIYTTSKNNIRITGVNSDATVKVFNILGKQVLESSFNSKGVSDIAIPTVNTGVYIIQLTTTQGKLNKKIVLE